MEQRSLHELCVSRKVWEGFLYPRDARARFPPQKDEEGEARRVSLVELDVLLDAHAFEAGERALHGTRGPAPRSTVSLFVSPTFGDELTHVLRNEGVTRASSSEPVCWAGSSTRVSNLDENPNEIPKRDCVWRCRGRGRSGRALAKDLRENFLQTGRGAVGAPAERVSHVEGRFRRVQQHPLAHERLERRRRRPPRQRGQPATTRGPSSQICC